MMHPVSFMDIFHERIMRDLFDCPDSELKNGAYFRFCSRFFRRNTSSTMDRDLDDRKKYRGRPTDEFTDATACSP